MARKEETDITKFLSKEEIFIDHCDGLKTIAKSEDIFDLCIDPSFKEGELAEVSHPTRKTKVNISEVVKNASLMQIFGSIIKNHDIDKLCLTQHQISLFCKDHKSWLRGDTYGTLFLVKKGFNYYVADVHYLGGRLTIYKHHIGDSSIKLKGACLHRVVTRSKQ